MAPASLEADDQETAATDEMHIFIVLCSAAWRCGSQRSRSRRILNLAGQINTWLIYICVYLCLPSWAITAVCWQ